MRFHAAIALAILYAICVVSPTLALAIGKAGALPCLAGDHHGLTLVHSEDAVHHHGSPSTSHGGGHAHHDGKARKHEQPAPLRRDGKQADGACCAVLCITALTADLGVEIGHPIQVSMIAPPVEPVLAGRDPARIDRPPSTNCMTV